MVAGNVYQVATKRLELHRRKSLHVRRFIDWHHCRIKSSHCCKCARIRRCIQENVVTWVDQHLKHLKWGGEMNRGQKTGWWHQCFLRYLTEALLASWGHTHVHLSILRGTAGCGWVVKVLLQVLHPRQQLRYSTWSTDTRFIHLHL